MRLTGLLAVLLFFLIVFFAAPAASYAQTPAPAADSKTEVMQGDNVRIERQLVGNAAPEGDRPIVMAQPLLEHGGDMVFRDYSRDGTCYTMRTYVMAREDKDSDTTRMVRYQKCLPSWKLDLKTAIAPLKSDSKSGLTPYTDLPSLTQDHAADPVVRAESPK
jgi:hypothetical protein